MQGYFLKLLDQASDIHEEALQNLYDLRTGLILCGAKYT